MQNGGFQSQPLMRLTLGLTLVFLLSFTVTNFALYFAKMDLTPSSVTSYYNGSEQEFRVPRTYQSMLEVTHGHLAIMAVVLLMLTHLLIFTPFSKPAKVFFISAAFLFALLDEGAGWLVRFLSPEFALLKVLGFVGLQANLIFLLASLAVYLWYGWRRSKQLHLMAVEEEREDEVAEEEQQLP